MDNWKRIGRKGRVGSKETKNDNAGREIQMERKCT